MPARGNAPIGVRLLVLHAAAKRSGQDSVRHGGVGCHGVLGVVVACATDSFRGRRVTEVIGTHLPRITEAPNALTQTLPLLQTPAMRFTTLLLGTSLSLPHAGREGRV